MLPARMLANTRRKYSGGLTDPSRWSAWKPRKGDVIVCTPPKCGTTWTQTILAMLVNGGPDLPDRVSVLSPWLDANLGIPANEVVGSLDAQTGRRIIKTHTPADGFPVWEDVTIVAVYRHPLDVFFSYRRHVENTVKVSETDSRFLLPISQSFREFLEGDVAPEDFGHDKLSKLTMHYIKTACSDRSSQLKLFHYTDMLEDGRAAVEQLARAIGIQAETSLIDRVTEATAFDAMKANADKFNPSAGTGYFKSDAAFFDSASSGKWQRQLSGEDLELYAQRLIELVPDNIARSWLENGSSLGEN